MPRIAIIGAGLAGLTCAKILHDRGVTDFVLFEQSDRPGGRVRTDLVDGFRLDRGFQVLFTAYPAVRRHLNGSALELCAYRPGAVLVCGRQRFLLGDPLRDWRSLLPSLRNPLVPWGDKLRVLALRAQLAATPIARIWQQPDRSTRDFLHRWGFADRTVRHFFEPFYGGIFLDPELSTSARLFQFYFKMLAEGEIVTPAEGMGAIADQLASYLPPDCLHCHTAVERIEVAGDRVAGIVLADGSEVPCETLVCAADAPAARRLLSGRVASDRPIPTAPRSVTCLYFSSPVSLYEGALIWLNSDRSPDRVVNTCMQLSNVSPALAPEGQHLLSVSVVGNPPGATEDLVECCRRELRDWFPQDRVQHLAFLRDYRIPFAQFEQPPGIHDRLPAIATSVKGLVLAGEFLRHSSIQGAMQSGEDAAKAVLPTGN